MKPTSGAKAILGKRLCGPLGDRTSGFAGRTARDQSSMAEMALRSIADIARAVVHGG